MCAPFVDGPAGNSVLGAVGWSLAPVAIFAPPSVGRYRRAVTA